MLRKRLRPAGIFLVVAATGLALLQMSRHRLQAVERPNTPACTSTPAPVETPASASIAPKPASIVLRLDYAGAEALINALERDSLSDAAVDSLLGIRGLCAMVDNVPRFFPGHGVAEFRKDIRAFARTKKGGDDDRYFQLSDTWQARFKVRALLAEVQTNERAIVRETISQLERYRPDTGSLTVTVYLVAGGVSDGFAFENDPRSFFANLVRADVDLNGLVLNMAHEAYHVMQFRAQEHASIVPLSVAADTTPPVARLFLTTLFEGTANYVADPTRSTATGAAMDSARKRYQRNREPQRMATNFARFDAVLSGLRNGRMTWDKAYAEGFTSENDASFYFVGYEMTRALERYCGRECIGRLFQEPPVEFFRRYVALYHKYPELAGHFSPETEGVIATYGPK